MILYELTGGENHAVYQTLEVANGNRQYDFLHSIVDAATAMGRPFLSEHLIKALNFHAIICLHTNAGEYRPCPVEVGTGAAAYVPPMHHQVDALMEDFVNVVNRTWTETDAVALASYVLWRLNYIHPFINGNGRTARAACYFVLCLHIGQWLPGNTILPELIRRDRPQYVAALRSADNSFRAGDLDLSELHGLLTMLIHEQIHGTPPQADAEVTPPQE